VIIPVHNGGDAFRKCLESIASTNPSPFEIIVVVDGATDGSASLAHAFATHVLTLPTSGGPAKARNLGADKALGSILFFVDADVTIRTDAVARVIAAFEKDPGLAAVFGSYDDEPYQPNFLSQYKNLLHHYVHQAGQDEAFTFWAACGAVRADVFRALKGFDERYGRPSIEDIELGYRIKAAGYRIRLQKDLQVTHLKRWTIASLLQADFFLRALPWTELILKRGGFTDDLNLKISNRMSVALVYISLLIFAASIFAPWLFAFAVMAIVLLLVINWDLYRFFAERRGVGFTCLAVPWHWFYYFYSGLAFAIAYVGVRLRSPYLFLCALGASVVKILLSK
jgi:GT2 family glycosyltransferase